MRTFKRYEAEQILDASRVYVRAKCYPPEITYVAGTTYYSECDAHLFDRPKFDCLTNAYNRVFRFLYRLRVFDVNRAK